MNTCEAISDEDLFNVTLSCAIETVGVQEKFILHHDGTGSTFFEIVNQAYNRLPCSLFSWGNTIDKVKVAEIIERKKKRVLELQLRGRREEVALLTEPPFYLDPLNRKNQIKDSQPAKLKPDSLQPETSIFKSSLFNDSLSREFVWRSGSHYTPYALALQIVQKLFSLRPLSALDSLVKIIDPSCGGGIFLLAIIDYFHHYLKETDAMLSFIHNNLRGVDTNREALFFAEYSILSLLKRTNPKLSPTDLPSLYGSTLLHDDYLIPNNRSGMMKQVLDITKASSIDYILGNPPFGLSRDGRIHHDDAQNQVSRHGEKLRGNISSYLLFLSAGFNSLKPSGSMALITPNAWLGIRSAELFRTNLLEENSILRIETNPDKAFEQCSVETITVYLSKKEPQGPISLSKINRVGEVGSEYSTISTTSCLSRPNKTIPLMWNEQFEEIFKEIKLRAKTIGEMGDYFRPFIALQEYSVGQGTPPQTKNCSIIREFHSFTKHSEEWFPFLLGRDVDRFSINWSGQYLHYGPWLAQPCVKGRYQMPRVIIREVTGAKPHLLRSVATSAPLFYNRSLLHILIFPKTINSKTSPEIRANDESALKLAKALSAILNSTIINTFFLFHGRKVQRKLFPKVLSEDLRDIPIPHLFLDGYDDLADVVNNLCGDERDTKIDQIVSEMFKLPETICAQFKEQLR